MAKNILRMMTRMFIISALLYGSYYLYTFYTYSAIQIIDFGKIRISFMIHSLIFFLIGIALKFDTRLISGIKKKTVKMNFVKLGMAVVSLIVLLFLKYNTYYMCISHFIAFFVGFFLIESFECEQQIKL